MRYSVLKRSILIYIHRTTLFANVSRNLGLSSRAAFYGVVVFTYLLRKDESSYSVNKFQVSWRQRYGDELSPTMTHFRFRLCERLLTCLQL